MCVSASHWLALEVSRPSDCVLPLHWAQGCRSVSLGRRQMIVSPPFYILLFWNATDRDPRNVEDRQYFHRQCSLRVPLDFEESLGCRTPEGPTPHRSQQPSLQHWGAVEDSLALWADKLLAFPLRSWEKRFFGTSRRESGSVLLLIPRRWLPVAFLCDISCCQHCCTLNL